MEGEGGREGGRECCVVDCFMSDFLGSTSALLKLKGGFWVKVTPYVV